MCYGVSLRVRVCSRVLCGYLLSSTSLSALLSGWLRACYCLRSPNNLLFNIVRSANLYSVRFVVLKPKKLFYYQKNNDLSMHILLCLVVYLRKLAKMLCKCRA